MAKTKTKKKISKKASNKKLETTVTTADRDKNLDKRGSPRRTPERRGTQLKSKKEANKPVVPPVGENERSDDDALIGRAAEYKGIEGTISRVTSYKKNGYADKVVFRPRRNMNSPMTIKYDDVEPLPNGFR